jgi:hypothetical protein
VVARLGEQRITGQLRLLSHPQHAIALDGGTIIGASSSHIADTCVRVALTNRLIAASQVTELVRRIEAAPRRDEVEVVASAAKLSPERTILLRRRLVMQRAARTFSFDRLDHVIEDRITLPRHPTCKVDVGAVIFLGVLTNLSDARIAQDLRRLGARFKLEPKAIRELARFELPEAARPLLDTLRTTTSLPELEAIHRDIDPRMTQATVYALLACGACTVVHEAEPRIARGTAQAAPQQRPEPPEPRLATGTTEPATARRRATQRDLPAIPAPAPVPAAIAKPLKTITIPRRKGPTKR